MKGPGISSEWRPGASRHALEARATLLADIRRFFGDRRVMEVETPILSAAGTSDPNIRCMATDSLRKRYLRTSPEYAMKRLLAAGFRDIYEIGRVFRAGETGAFHNPEFTLLEWYRIGMHYLDLASEVVDLCRQCGGERFADWDEQCIAYRDLFREGIGLDPFHCSESELAACAGERGIAAGPLEHSEWLDLILAEILQPALPGETFTIVFDFPPEQAALARVRAADTPVAERFELFAGQVELANGYQELDDVDEQLTRFRREQGLRAARGDDAVPMDRHLLEALGHGLPECSGVALGVDRLLMCILKLDRIDAVLAFGTERA